MTNTRASEILDISTTGGNVKINLDGRTIVEVAVRGDVAATYRVDGRESGSANWKEGVRSDYSGSSNYDDTITTGWNELRLVVTSTTGTSGDSATVTLCAGGR